ncbi:MAG: DUF2069 domain-containing protein, partial [bacterium]
MVFLPGLARGGWKTYMWLCFALMVYFCMTVTELFGPNKELTDALELVAISVVFVAAMFYGRWRRQELANEENVQVGQADSDRSRALRPIVHRLSLTNRMGNCSVPL